MDEVIQSLDDMFNNGRLSEYTYGVLHRLAKKRTKERNWFRVKNGMAIALGLGYLLLLYLIQPLFNSDNFNGRDLLVWFLTAFHFFLITGMIILQFGFKIVIDKYDEVDGKYDRLRKEILEREPEIWNRHVEDLQSRPSIVAMFDKHKVNLYHK